MKSRRLKNGAKTPRRLHIDELLAKRSTVLRGFEELRALRSAEVDATKGDAPRFLSEVCRLKLFKYVLDLAELYKLKQFLAVRWPRQTGKSTVIGGLMLQDAYENPDMNIAFLGPSFRQTKLNLRRVGSFCRNLPSGSCTVQRTRISFKNGSIIEAFPNNPDTIRGNTFNRIWWDECNFTAGDYDLYDAILFTLGTTNGKLVASSTPFNSDSLFWKMCNSKDYEGYERHHFSWEQALAPEGPLNPDMVERIKKQFGDDRQRWRREMEAEWSEDEDVWLPQSLIVSCVGTAKSCGQELQQYDPERSYSGEFYAGLDLAQIRDFCVLCVLERINDQLYLRLLKIFPQPTTYAHVLGYIKQLQDRWGGFEKIRVDFTREGPSIINDMENAGVNNAEGVNFSVPRKSEMASLLKQRMSSRQLFYPLLSWERPYRSDLCSELNVERYDLRTDGNIGYSHPKGTHDDVFWSMALAVYATTEMTPEPFLTVIPR
jgi:phage FluMu gp28-like protein